MPLSCEYCRATVRVVMPVPIDELVALSRAFEDRHAECLLDRKEHTGSCADPACETCLTGGLL